MFAYEIKVKVISKQNGNGAQLAKMLAEKKSIHLETKIPLNISYLKMKILEIMKPKQTIKILYVTIYVIKQM